MYKPKLGLVGDQMLERDVQGHRLNTVLMFVD